MGASNRTWSRLATHDFWGSISPSDHVVQIYNDDQTFLDLLEGFVTSGFAANDCVIVIATDEHQHALEERLKYKGYDVFDLKLQDQYIPLNARETLGEFIINNWPDEVLFRHMINRFLARARSRNRNARAFGEMVALLWAQGNIAATVQLENLWNKICQDEELSLFCAYPKSSLNQRALESILQICGSHSKMIKADRSHQGILYKEVQSNGKKRQTAS
jgi:hypothetical protein